MLITDPFKLDITQVKDLLKMFSYKEVARLLGTHAHTLVRLRNTHKIRVSSLRKEHRITTIKHFPDLTNEALAAMLGCGTAEVAKLAPDRNPCRYYVVTDPDGNESTITNIREYFTARGINPDNIYQVINGKRKTCRGYICRRKEQYEIK